MGVSILGSAAAVVAQPALIVDIAPCVDIESVLERLECYDGLAREARAVATQTRPAGPAVPESAVADGAAPAGATPGAGGQDGSRSQDADSAEAAAAASAGTESEAPAVEEFGFEPQLSRRERNERRQARTDEELLARVVGLREIVPGQLEVTLDNGQVWRQTRSDRYRLRVGHDVRIYVSRFGNSYRLTAPELRGFVQVERVR